MRTIETVLDFLLPKHKIFLLLRLIFFFFLVVMVASD